MAVTMHDVARLAGVSVKTVSNVVNDYPYIRPTTRERVLTAIDELGYQVNVTARNLRTGRTGTIGLALPELSLPYFAELADAVIAAAERSGVTVVLELTGGRREREIQMLSGPNRRLADGLIFSPLGMGPGDESLLRVSYPLVVLGERIFSDEVDHVTMQNVEAARAATEHIVGLGRRRIALLGTHPGEELGTAALRQSGYERALRDAGLSIDERLLAPSMEWHRSSGARAMAGLLDAGVVPDGVFAMNDALALGALHELQVRHLRVPEDVAVVGFDAIDEGSYANPSLSTVDPGREEIARTAVRLLLERVESGPSAPTRLHLADYRVLERGTTVVGRI